MTEGKFQPGNQSPNTPDLSETDLRGMHMQQLIDLAHQEQLEGVDDMRRDDLIRAIGARYRERREQPAGVGGRQGGGVGQERSQAAGGQAEGKSQPGNQSPNTPDLSETALRGMQMAELRDRARRDGVQGADELTKDDLIREISARHRQLHPQQ